MKTISIELADDLHARFKALATEEQDSMANITRRLIREKVLSAILPTQVLAGDASCTLHPGEAATFTPKAVRHEDGRVKDVVWERGEEKEGGEG